MRILVTGATGFIGEYFCHALRREGHSVTGLDLIPPREGLPLDRFVRGDVRDPDAVRKALEGCDSVLNLAAAHHDFGIAHETYFGVNETGARILCDEMDRAGIGRCCGFSSVAIYGDTAKPVVETSEPHPLHDYGASKLAGERVFRQWTAKGGGRSCLVIRPTVTFGPNNFANMYSLIRQIHRGRFVVAGDGSNVKSLSYVENLVAATMYLWPRHGDGFEPFNFIDKPDLTSGQIAATVAASLGRRSAGLRLPIGAVLALAKPFDLVIKVTGRNLPVSSMRVRKLFLDETRFEADKLTGSGFRPPVPLREGIDRMVKWYLATGRNQSPFWRLPPGEIQRFG